MQLKSRLDHFPKHAVIWERLCGRIWESGSHVNNVGGKDPVTAPLGGVAKSLSKTRLTTTSTLLIWYQHSTSVPPEPYPEAGQQVDPSPQDRITCLTCPMRLANWYMGLAKPSACRFTAASPPPSSPPNPRMSRIWQRLLPMIFSKSQKYEMEEVQRILEYQGRIYHSDWI